jgi:hypothetical protein
VARLIKGGLLAALAVSGLLLSGCGVGAGVANARQACTFVHHALALERASSRSLTIAQSRALAAQALAELLHAEPFAAAATSADGSWNPLQTTLQEANRVPLRFEAPALLRLCQVADSSSPYL